MRVVAGLLRGRRLSVPPGLALRPTPNKVREALFNILSDEVFDATFLDLYAGSGAIGIEALSRGARAATFVEQDLKHLKYLKKNLSTVSLDEKSTVFGLTAEAFLKRSIGSFDFVFLDPPYASREIEKLLPRLQEGDMIAPNGRLVIEHFYKHVLPEKIGKITFLKKYRYGETILSFYGTQ